MHRTPELGLSTRVIIETAWLATKRHCQANALVTCTVHPRIDEEAHEAALAIRTRYACCVFACHVDEHAHTYEQQTCPDMQMALCGFTALVLVVSCYVVTCRAQCECLQLLWKRA